MADCKQSEGMMERLIEGSAGKADFSQHLENCSQCRELLEIHLSLSDAAKSESFEPIAADLNVTRQEVLRSLRTNPSGRSSLAASWLPGFFRSPVFAAAASATILVAGFLIGYGGIPGMGTRSDDTASNSARPATFAQQMAVTAADNQQLIETQNSPYVYSNVQVREIDPETVALSFDVATHLDLVRPKSDPLVTEILVQSLVTPGPLGTRLEAISMAPTLEPKVRGALIVAMLEDSNLAVRLKALAKLSEETPDSEVAQATLEVLKREESVQMRLMAVDYLAAVKIAPTDLTAALAEGLPEPGTAIEARAQRYLATVANF